MKTIQTVVSTLVEQAANISRTVGHINTIAVKVQSITTILSAKLATLRYAHQSRIFDPIIRRHQYLASWFTVNSWWKNPPPASGRETYTRMHLATRYV